MTDDRPDPLPSPDGRSGWYAFNPDGSRTGGDDDPWEPPREGSLIRLMGEDTVTVPLWSDDGLMFNERDDLVREFGVSPTLAADLETWAAAWQTHSGQPHHDAEAAGLVRRLKQELDYRFVIVYNP